MFDVVIGRSESDREKLGTKGTILLGKHFVKMGRVTSLSNPVYMDMTRSHVVFICGKRGCLTEDTLVFTDKGYKKIIDFNVKKDKILALDKNKLAYEWFSNVQLLSYPIKNEDLFKITFEDGQSLTLTEEHPLLVHENTKNTWKIAAEIKKTDLIVSSYKIPVISNNSVNKRIARLLGFILADGTMQIKKGDFVDGRGYSYNGKKARLRIISAEENILNQAKKDLDEEFGINAKIYPKGKENCSLVCTEQQKVVNTFHKLGVPLGKKDKIISVPNCIWTSSNAIKKEFLKALFSCDGFVDKNGSRVVYYSNSEKIMFDLNLLLGHFGIQSRIRTKKTTCNGKSFLSYQLDIMDYSSIKNFEKIGFYQVEKNDRLKRRKFNQVKRRKSTKYLNNDLFCQKIKKIQKVKGITNVYDLRVPKHHSFIANGIISHNSGKSYTMGAIAEGMADLPPDIKKNISIIMLDTMGIYWTMKYPNKKEKSLLNDWGLQSKGLDVKIYTPTGYYKEYKEKGIPTDMPFSVLPGELSAVDWLMTFGIHEDDPVGVLIERVIHKLSEEKGTEYSVEDIIAELLADEDAEKTVKLAAKNRFLNVENWGLFDEKGTPLKELARGGQVTVLDVSCYATMPGSWNIKNLVIGLVAQKLFIQRMIARKDEEYADVHDSVNPFSDAATDKQEYPLVWLVIDEAHEFLPVEGKTLATDPLVTILREGRQPGISLVLATQQPGKIHTDVMTQSDTVISHRITARLDTEALGMLMQSYMRKGLVEELDNLPRLKGAAIIFDDTNERMYPIRVRPRFTWHGGEAPNALKNAKDEIKF